MSKLVKGSGYGTRGTLTLTNKRADGSIERVTNVNMVVKFGLVSIAGAIAGIPWALTNVHLALGDSNTPAALGDDSLGNELRRDIAVVTQLAFPEDNKVQFQVEHVLGAVVGTFREAGLLDSDGTDPENDNMFNRLVFADFVVGSGDTLTETWLIETRNA